MKTVARRSAAIILSTWAALSWAQPMSPNCDATRKKYADMMTKGEPMSEADMACMVAVMTRKPSKPIPPIKTASAPSWKDEFKKAGTKKAP